MPSSFAFSSICFVRRENGSGPEIDAFQRWMLEQFPMSNPVAEPVVGTVDVQNDEFTG